MANPGRPNQAFDPFVQAILRQIGVALELPFEVLIKHFTSSYTAARGALLDAWRYFSRRRDWLADNFCQPVFEAWLADEVARGKIAAPGFFSDYTLRAAYCGSQWVGDAPAILDEYKEAKAAELNLQLGRTTLAKETLAYDGSDWRDNLQQRGREKKIAKENGVDSSPAPQPGSVAPGDSGDAADPEDPSQQDGAPQDSGGDQPAPPARRAATSEAALLAALNVMAGMVSAMGKQSAPGAVINLPESMQHAVEHQLKIAGLDDFAALIKQQGAINGAQLATLTAELRTMLAGFIGEAREIANEPIGFVTDENGTVIGAAPVRGK